jgi:serine/threonine protein kinase
LNAPHGQPPKSKKEPQSDDDKKAPEKKRHEPPQAAIQNVLKKAGFEVTEGIAEPQHREFLRGSLEKELSKLGYQITGRLGEGGMGTVFKARFTGNPKTYGIPKDAKIAIKVLSDRSEDRPEVRMRFFREASLGRIPHPYFARVYDSGEVDGRPYYVMDRLEGQDLASMIRGSQEHVDLKKALFYIREVCYALEELHSRGIVHRDIKPENIFILKDDKGVKLIDLGLAKLTDLSQNGGPRLTKDGCTSGTPAYMPPESAFGREEGVQHDHRGDIYSLGVTMYELICGVPPFEGVNYLALVYKHATEIPEPFQKMRDDIPKDAETWRKVEHLVMHCLEKKPDDRFQNVRELIGAIDSCGIKLEKSPVAHLTSEEKAIEPIQEVPKKQRQVPLVAKIVVPIALAASLIVPGYYKLFKETPQPKERVEQIEKGVYKAKIETTPPGVTVMVEEKIEGGTVVSRRLGETPLEEPLEGKQVIYLELDGYQRAYFTVSPKNNTLSHKMQKRELDK